MSLLELFGYLGTLIVLLSYISDGIKLRMLSIFACIIFICYGIAIADGPVIFTNASILLVNMYKIIRESVNQNIFGHYRIKCNEYQRLTHDGKSSKTSIKYEYIPQYKDSFFSKWKNIVTNNNSQMSIDNPLFNLSTSSVKSEIYKFKSVAYDIIEKHKELNRNKLKLKRTIYFK